MRVHRPPQLSGQQYEDVILAKRLVTKVSHMAHGKIGAFVSAQETWDTYIERLELFLQANAITNVSKKRAILLTVCGPATYKLIRNLVTCGSAVCRTREDRESAHDDTTARPTVMVQRFIFYTWTQRSGETVATFVAEPTQLTEHCGFGTSLDDMLLDRLVCGIADLGIQRKRKRTSIWKRL